MTSAARRLLGCVAICSITLLVTNVSAETLPASAPQTQTLTWAELSRMPLPPPGERIKYGDAPQQFGELRVPKGDGPFPVFVVIHGGCWQNAFDYVYMTHLAAWLTEHGFATWTIEYRRLGDDGGGWPGTFLDAANAPDVLRQIATTARIDLTRVYTTGHSAGGQLALWLATRAKLRETSELYAKDPVAIRGVLGLAAITDLAQYRVGPPKSCHASVEPLLGGTPETVRDRYAATSPIERLPLGVPQVFIQGGKDPIVSADSVRAFVEAAKARGDNAVLLPLDSLGHFESAVPLPSTVQALTHALRILLGNG
jgi:acetyl esterase/lipase